MVPDSLNQIALLQVRCNDTLRLIAKGEQAGDALAAFKQLAAENFGESLESANADNKAAQAPSKVTGTAFCYTPFSPEVNPQLAASLQAEQQRLQTAIQSTLNDLSELTALAEERYSADIAAIFSGHHTLLDDPELFEMACDVMREKQCSAAWAWHQVLSDLSQQYLQLDDPYLQARYIDIEDLLSRSLQHLTGESAQIPAFLRPLSWSLMSFIRLRYCNSIRRPSKVSACGTAAKPRIRRLSLVKWVCAGCVSKARLSIASRWAIL